MKKTLNVLIVDDSVVFTKFLQAILNSEPGIQVIGCAKDGIEAVQMAKQFRPDLITMDVYMPNMDGVEATKVIMDECPTPIILISAHVDTDKKSYIFHALEAGALSMIEKPHDYQNGHFEAVRRHIINSILSLSEVHVTRRPLHKKLSKHKRFPEHTFASKARLVALGASTGGPLALNAILTALPDSFAVPIVITQHITAGFLSGLVTWLQKNTALTVQIATHQQPLLPGHVYFAPDNVHLTIIKHHNDPIAILEDSAPVSHVRPSIDKLFTSIAQSYPGAAIGGLLTGMGQDGAQGLLKMRKTHCITFAQSESSSIVYGMPAAAVTLEAVQHVVNLEQISHFLIQLIDKGMK